MLGRNYVISEEVELLRQMEAKLAAEAAVPARCVGNSEPARAGSVRWVADEAVMNCLTGKRLTGCGEGNRMY